MGMVGDIVAYFFLNYLFIYFCLFMYLAMHIACWGASLVAQMVKNLPAMQETGLDLWVRKIPQRRERLPTLIFLTGECHE